MFTTSAADLIISPPDGYIRVHNQLATPAGHLERLRLGNGNRDDWIDAAQMRALAAGQ